MSDRSKQALPDRQVCAGLKKEKEKMLAQECRSPHLPTHHLAWDYCVARLAACLSLDCLLHAAVRDPFPL